MLCRIGVTPAEPTDDADVGLFVGVDGAAPVIVVLVVVVVVEPLAVDIPGGCSGDGWIVVIFWCDIEPFSIECLGLKLW